MGQFLWTWKSLRTPRSPAYLGRFISAATVSQSWGRWSLRAGGEWNWWLESYGFNHPDGQFASRAAKPLELGIQTRKGVWNFPRWYVCVVKAWSRQRLNWNVSPFSEQQLSVLWLRQNPGPSENHSYFVITPWGGNIGCDISPCLLQQHFSLLKCWDNVGARTACCQTPPPDELGHLTDGLW